VETLWTSEHLTIGEIIKAGDKGSIALPRFQRRFVWSAPAQLSFLAAVLRNLPSGALLLLETDPDEMVFAPIELDGAPALSSTNRPERLILDGQQRTTTLYRAFNTAAPNKTFEVDVKAIIAVGEFSDEHLTIARGGSGSIAQQAERGVVALPHLIDPPKMAGWYATYSKHHLGGDDSQIEELMRLVRAHLPGAESDSSHQLPVIKIKKGAPLAAVINVFEGINRRGTRLNGFDLMVARLYRETSPGKYFDLRERWVEEAGKCPNLTRIGFNVDRDGLLPLQVIALAVSRLPDGTRPSGVRGVKQTDVLELPPSQVIGDRPKEMVLKGIDLGASFGALNEAVKFLRDHCGVMEWHLLPQASMLIPLADQFLLPKTQRLQLDQLKRWFFASGLQIRYYGSVNSYVESDCRQLRAWKASDGEEVPTAIKQLTRDYVNGLSFLQPNSREGAILGKTIMSMIIASGALDWRSGQLDLKGLDERIQIHHAVPREVLLKIRGARGELDPIAVLTPITQSRNGSLRDKSPQDVHGILGADAGAILESHQFDPELFAEFGSNKTKLNQLLQNREARLRAFVISMMTL
jgi:hypothetical protein